VDLFRVDVVSPVGDSDEIKTLPKKFPSLINPFLYDTLFVETSTEERKRSQVPRRLQPSRALRRSTRVEGTPRGSLYTSRRIAWDTATPPSCSRSARPRSTSSASSGATRSSWRSTRTAGGCPLAIATWSTGATRRQVV